MGKYVWQQCSMVDALKFSDGREINSNYCLSMDRPDAQAEVVIFTDGSAVACKSKWNGPYSEETPDIDAAPPIWWIGTLKE